MNTKSRVLILEDDWGRVIEFKNKFPDSDYELDVVENADEAIELLKEHVYSLICLDHDLDGEVYVNSLDPNTGYQVTVWMSKNKHVNIDTPVVIHSYNPVGASNMFTALACTNHKGKVVRQPGFWLQ